MIVVFILHLDDLENSTINGGTTYSGKHMHILTRALLQIIQNVACWLLKKNIQICEFVLNHMMDLHLSSQETHCWKLLNGSSIIWKCRSTSQNVPYRGQK